MLKERAKTYWDRRLQLGKSASNKDAFRKELAHNWRMVPLEGRSALADGSTAALMMNAGFAPNDGIGVIDNLAQQDPEKIDQVIEIMRALVHQPDVEPWIFGSQEQSLRKVLEEGKKSASPATVAGVKEIISHLSSRGNASFLDLDEVL